jgi:pterin-4a-carbinolamine dehydratase
MPKSVKISNHLVQHSEEKNKEEELINEVRLLLKTLVYQEEVTIKGIIDCLYDIGSVNLINQKFKFGTFNKTLKFMTKMSKPAFRILAWQWFKKNCPDLITTWLQGKVTFVTVEEAKVEVVTENENRSLVSMSELPAENQFEEVNRLHLQVKLLTGVLVTVVTLFGGSLIWLNYSLQQSHLETVEKLQNQVKTLESSNAGRN